MDGKEPLQLRNGVSVIINAEIHSHIVITEISTAFTNDKHSRGLPSATVSSGTVASKKRNQESR
jgi:hypothetical protein